MMIFTNTWYWLLVVTGGMVYRADGQADDTMSALGVIAQYPGGDSQLAVHTVVVNRFGSMCPVSTIVHTVSSSNSQTASVFTSQIANHATSQIVSHIAATTTSTSSATAASTTLIPTPAPNQFPTSCATTPVCPALDKYACLDASGQIYGIFCNTTFTGLAAFPPRKLRPRTFATDLESCLAICDEEGGCHGVSYGFAGPSEQNCVLFGSLTATKALNGSIAARRIPSYGGDSW